MISMTSNNHQNQPVAREQSTSACQEPPDINIELRNAATGKLLNSREPVALQ